MSLGFAFQLLSVPSVSTGSPALQTVSSAMTSGAWVTLNMFVTAGFTALKPAQPVDSHSPMTFLTPPGLSRLVTSYVRTRVRFARSEMDGERTSSVAFLPLIQSSWKPTDPTAIRAESAVAGSWAKVAGRVKDLRSQGQEDWLKGSADAGPGPGVGGGEGEGDGAVPEARPMNLAL